MHSTVKSLWGTSPCSWVPSNAPCHNTGTKCLCTHLERMRAPRQPQTLHHGMRDAAGPSEQHRLAGAAASLKRKAQIQHPSIPSSAGLHQPGQNERCTQLFSSEIYCFPPLAKAALLSRRGLCCHCRAVTRRRASARWRRHPKALSFQQMFSSCNM